MTTRFIAALCCLVELGRSSISAFSPPQHHGGPRLLFSPGRAKAIGIAARRPDGAAQVRHTPGASKASRLSRGRRYTIISKHMQPLRAQAVPSSDEDGMDGGKNTKLSRLIKSIDIPLLIYFGLWYLGNYLVSQCFCSLLGSSRFPHFVLTSLTFFIYFGESTKSPTNGPSKLRGERRDSP